MTEDTPLSGSDPQSPADPPKTASVAIEFLTLGLGSALCLAVGAGIGLAIDALAGTSPIFTLIGLGFGVVIGILYTVSKVRQNL
jgi:F0F1-type ATP synthase assembly protein I